MQKRSYSKSIEVFYGVSSPIVEDLIHYLIDSNFDIKDLPPEFRARPIIVTPHRVEIEIKGGIVVTIIMRKRLVSLIVEESSRKGEIKVK
ncbi:hypothetical protein [Sulfuracidifex tepidarius]|uniref:Uncharacterized protein n=1 Tax=Sulfuracidifex tepidarius TaxID=1294262 RepID=A0A510DX05_9CREN|nr:hypothetical protein [Sulfuracidifex tepidarius]BBG24752.1 hypothetical protein IC006_2086 [Sulfuracidifex tepidarius]BBG27541.1 hypothetical protein IC007_2095 [Sulfuracidifex tepidarius]